MTASLSVNINKIALLRNSRSGNYPDLLAHARHCIEAGAAGITVHPRPDQRHVRADDIQPLAQLLAGYPGIEFNIEGNPFAPARGSYPGFMELVQLARPQQCTLVPDQDDQLTSDHGFDLRQDAGRLAPVISQLRAWGCRVSLFLDPDPGQVALAHSAGADRIELYTGHYAGCHASGDTVAWQAELDRHVAAAQVALGCGLGINAGHDLNLANLPLYAARVPGLLEVSIGHALTVDALALGLPAAIRAYLHALAG